VIAQLVTILTDILLPILLLMAAGAMLQRLFGMHMDTLVKLNLYLFTPGFVFRYVATAQIGGDAMLGIVVASLLLAGLMAGVTFAAGKLAGASWVTISGVMLATMVYNSGNYGVPLAVLGFGEFGAAVQAFVLSTQSILTFTVGLALAGSSASGNWRETVGKMLRIPIIYALVAALVLRWAVDAPPDELLPTWLDATTLYLAGGLVPVALVTLGAQLAKAPSWPRWRPVSFAMVLRLAGGPALMAAVVYAIRFIAPGSRLDLLAIADASSGATAAAVVIVTAGVPTAVNTLLLTMEMKGDAKLAGDCVFWTTILSPVTLLATIAVVRTFM
jgi:predicted permease